MSHVVANAARLIAEPARAAMLVRLMGGRAVPAGELALIAHVSPQTASEHLSRLNEAGFITVQRLGRHRYYKLANEEVAYVVESLLVLSAPPPTRGKANPPALGSLEYARTCYAHLAGWTGVAITDALVREGYIEPGRSTTFSVTDRGQAWFSQQGIAVPNVSKAAEVRFARQCPDWTERRPHLAGTLGVAMYRRFVELGWIEETRKSRIVRITLEGRRDFAKYLHISVG
jgi:DNA-binding transcriptional ArsR family regulator